MQSQGGRLTLTPTGPTPEPVVRNDPLGLNVSAPVATQTWGAGDRTGIYTGYLVIVRAGLSPLNSANWVAADAVGVTLAP